MCSRIALACVMVLALSASLCLAQAGAQGTEDKPAVSGGVAPDAITMATKRPAGPIPTMKPIGTPAPTAGPKGTPTPAPTPASEPFTGTYKFVSIKDTTLVVTGMNSDTRSTFKNLAAEVAKSLAGAKPGDIVTLTGTKTKDAATFSGASVYTPKLGEDDPAAYVFAGKTQQTIGKDSFTVINVTKYNQPLAFAVPNIKDTSNKPVPTPAMQKIVDDLTAGVLVEVDAEASGKPAMLRAVRPYGDVKLAKFGKVVKAAASDKPAATATPAPAAPAGVEVQEAGTAETFMIDPAGKRAVMLAGKLAQFKEGQNVIVRLAKDDRGTWLYDIRLAPQQDPVAPKT